jgi:hypothetical protein
MEQCADLQVNRPLLRSSETHGHILQMIDDRFTYQQPAKVNRYGILFCLLS